MTGIPTGTVTSGGYSWTNANGLAGVTHTINTQGELTLPMWTQTVNGNCTAQSTSTGETVYSADGSYYFLCSIGTPYFNPFGGTTYVGGLYANQTLATFIDSGNPTKLTAGEYPNQIDQLASAGYIYQNNTKGPKVGVIPVPGTISGYIQQTAIVPSFPSIINVGPTSGGYGRGQCTPIGSFSIPAMTATLASTNYDGICVVEGTGQNGGANFYVFGYPQSPDGIKPVGTDVIWLAQITQNSGTQYAYFWANSIPGTFANYLPNYSPTTITLTG